MFPGGQQTVTLRFSPPRLPTTPSGEVPFAVKVIPSIEPEESVTEEGVITVGSFNDVAAELVPRVTTGRITGRQKLAVDSRGNVPVPVEISAAGRRRRPQVQDAARPPHAVAGEARFVRLRVKPRQRFWKGPQQQKPYKVQVAPEHEDPLVLDGALTQKAVLPEWAYTAALIAAAAALLWFFVLKPVVHSTAVNANKQALAVAGRPDQGAAEPAGRHPVDRRRQLRHQRRQRRRPGRPRQEAARHHDDHDRPEDHHHGGQGGRGQAADADHHDHDHHTTTTTTTTATTATTATTQPPPVTGPNDGRIEVVAAPGTTRDQLHHHHDPEHPADHRPGHPERRRRGRAGRRGAAAGRGGQDPQDCWWRTWRP